MSRLNDVRELVTRRGGLPDNHALWLMNQYEAAVSLAQQLGKALEAITDEADTLADRCDGEWCINDETFRKGEPFDLADAALEAFHAAELRTAREPSTQEGT